MIDRIGEIIIIVFVCAMVFTTYVFVIGKNKPTIERHYHYLLPENANCAIKEMFFTTKDGEQVKSVRKVCHWEHK